MPWYLHRYSIKPVLYRRQKWFFSRWVSGLDAFSPYPVERSYAACPEGQLLNQRLRLGVPFVLSEASSQPLNTHPVDSNRSGSRRSKPSSRSVLMGEHPHPWPRLHGQDTESRHRSNKPAGRYGLAPQTIQLSPEYLFCHTRASIQEASRVR